ncbi:hypothetical protein [Nocardia rhamnosiphila]
MDPAHFSRNGRLTRRTFTMNPQYPIDQAVGNSAARLATAGISGPAFVAIIGSGTAQC